MGWIRARTPMIPCALQSHIMSTMGQDRREFQRLQLAEPINARLGELETRIIDLGVVGARVESDSPFPAEDRAKLHILAEEGEIVLDCTIVHRLAVLSAGGRHRAGLQISAAIGDSGEKMRRLLVRLVSKAIEEASSGAPAAGKSLSFDPEQTEMRIPAPYLCYRLEDGNWRRRGAFIPVQPEAGFTVPAGEEPAELARLCREYENANEDGRRLLRLFAELRVCEALGVPRRSAS